MGESTVVNTLPFRLSEPKPGLVPSLYEIPAAPAKGQVGTLTVHDGYHLVVIPLTDERTPPMKVTDTSERIAQSLIDDFVSACLGVDYEVRDNGTMAIPGLFWLKGDVSPQVVVSKHASQVESAVKNTVTWFEKLVRLADDDWAKNHMHKAITDLQRRACSYLNLEREWNFDVLKNLSTNCWSCKSVVNNEAIVCPTCRAILNAEEYKKNKERFATV